MNYQRILIDTSNLYFRSYYASQQAVATVEGKQMATGGILTALKMIQRIERNYLAPEGRIYFLFDNALSGENRRKDIDPGYKVNRKKKVPQFYRGLDYLQLVLRHYCTGYRIVRRQASEADDLVAPILESFGDNAYSVLLISNDMDWSRAISDNVHWMIRKDGHDIIFTKQKFFEEYGFYPGVDEVCLYKAIRGDVSDNVPVGIPNIPESVVLDIVNRAKSVKNLFICLNELDIPLQWKEEVRKNKGRIGLNYQLVSYQPVSVASCRECTTISEFNKNMLGMFYKLLNFEPEKVDIRFRNSEESVNDDDFFKEFEVYPRAE